MIDIHSTQEFLNILSQAGDKLVIVEFYGTWCASCRALFPKLCKTAEEHPEILFLKVNFDENKQRCFLISTSIVEPTDYWNPSLVRLLNWKGSYVELYKAFVSTSSVRL